MNFTKITEEDLLNKGVFGLPDTPGLTTQQMQEKFDELSKDVIIPKLNALIEELEPIKSIERVSDSVEESDKSIPTGNAVKKLVDNKANELAKKPVYKSAGGFPEVGDAFTVYIDDTVSPRLLYTWDAEKGYILTGGSGGGGGETPSASIVLMEITSAVYEALPNNEKMRDDVQYFISDKGVIKYKDKSYGGNGGDVNIDYSELEFDTEEIVVENPMEDDKYNLVDQTPGKTFVGYVQNLPLAHNSIEYIGWVSFPFHAKNKNYNVEVLGAIQGNVGNVEPYIVAKQNDGFAFSVKKDITYAYQKCILTMEYTVTFA